MHAPPTSIWLLALLMINWPQQWRKPQIGRGGVQQSKRRNTNFPLATKSCGVGERLHSTAHSPWYASVSLHETLDARARSRSNYELKKFSGLINFTSAHRRFAFFINRRAEAEPTCPPCALITMKNAAAEIFQASGNYIRRRAGCERGRFSKTFLFHIPLADKHFCYY